MAEYVRKAYIFPIHSVLVIRLWILTAFYRAPCTAFANPVLRSTIPCDTPLSLHKLLLVSKVSTNVLCVFITAFLGILLGCVRGRVSQHPS